MRGADHNSPPARPPAQAARPPEGEGEEWEAAYRRFETPAEEVAKFEGRLRALGALEWPADSEILELFCGRGNGLRALARLGFARIEGVDLSSTLVEGYAGPGRCLVGDCRHLDLPDRSKDVAIVQGGLHHLRGLDDLERALTEASRILRPTGRFVAVEPWNTPFLRFVHVAVRSSIARRLSSKLDALATMIRCEGETYERWLGDPEAVLTLLHRYFRSLHCSRAWGKLMFVGTPRGTTPPGVEL